jgi:hypothetical protein
MRENRHSFTDRHDTRHRCNRRGKGAITRITPKNPVLRTVAPALKTRRPPSDTAGNADGKALADGALRVPVAPHAEYAAHGKRGANGI